MRRPIFHILIFLAFTFGALPAVAQTRAWDGKSNWCIPTSVPKVTIKSDTDGIKWVFNKSQKELNRQEIDTINPYGKSVITDVGGLMHGGITMGETMRFSSLINPNTNEVCMFYNDVEVSFHILPTIYIASEHRPGTCMHEAIKQHEMIHINTDRQIVNKYAALVGEAIRSEIRRKNVYGPVPVSNRMAIQSQMKTGMEQILKVYSQRMDAERRQRQQAVDNLQEYERVNNLCNKSVR